MSDEELKEYVVKDYETLVGKYRSEYLDKFYNMAQTVFDDGALKKKHKHLMAAAISITHGCHGCAKKHLQLAFSEGATLEEMAEMEGVVGTIFGGMGFGENREYDSFIRFLYPKV